MANPRYYVPPISRFLVSALYHEGRRRRVPMTRLVDELLTTALQGTPGWRLAEDAHRETVAFTANPTQTTNPKISLIRFLAARSNVTSIAPCPT